MVQINLIDPAYLTDQHLIAEYDEMLMLIAYVKKYPEEKDVPKQFVLGKGHIKFFKNKLTYLKNRHERIREEMKQRGFQTNKQIKLKEFPRNLKGDFIPKNKDIKLIKNRIKEKLELKPEFYRYYGEHKGLSFYKQLLRKA